VKQKDILAAMRARPTGRRPQVRPVPTDFVPPTLKAAVKADKGGSWAEKLQAQRNAERLAPEPEKQEERAEEEADAAASASDTQPDEVESERDGKADAGRQKPRTTRRGKTAASS
jgi:hypothetical protein